MPALTGQHISHHTVKMRCKVNVFFLSAKTKTDIS